MELGSTQQVGVGITDFSHTGATGVDLSQQGTAPKRVVHHLSLQSHADQSTSVPGTRMCDRSDTCQILDTALSGGRLSMTEHAERVTTTTNVAPLGELCSRVRDLQTAHAPVQRPALRRHYYYYRRDHYRGGSNELNADGSVKRINYLETGFSSSEDFGHSKLAANISLRYC